MPTWVAVCGSLSKCCRLMIGQTPRRRGEHAKVQTEKADAMAPVRLHFINKTVELKWELQNVVQTIDASIIPDSSSQSGTFSFRQLILWKLKRGNWKPNFLKAFHSAIGANQSSKFWVGSRTIRKFTVSCSHSRRDLINYGNFILWWKSVPTESWWVWKLLEIRSKNVSLPTLTICALTIISEVHHRLHSWAG